MERVARISDLFPGARGRTVLVVAAHPDDEIIGAGGQLAQWSLANVLHVTDGAPADMKDAELAGFSTREAYAAARRHEAEAALGLAGIPPARIRSLGFVDQQSSHSFNEFARVLLRILRQLAPRLVVTHSYEGGHPDHDSTAFAVHAACQLLGSARQPAPEIIEMTSYHNCGGAMQTGEFLPRNEVAEWTIHLSTEERELKKRMFDCFATQRHVLQWFPVEVERFRIAPAYDFSAPPHAGNLYYELFDRSMTGERWRALARKASRSLGIGQGLAAERRRAAVLCSSGD